MQNDIVQLLLDRIYASNAKHLLEDFLRVKKEESNAARSSFRVTGTREELSVAAKEALSSGAFSLLDLQQLTDKVEENGGQHILLFSLETSAVRRALDLVGAFPALPASPTAALYSEAPPQDRVHVRRDGDVVLIKQFRTAHYWTRDEAQSTSTDDRVVDVRVRKPARAVNLLRIDTKTRAVEVRISKVASDALAKDRLCTTLFLDLQAKLGDRFGFFTDCRPVEIWRGFAGILADRDRVFVAVDEARDASYRTRVSNRREGPGGRDVRESPNYSLAGPGYARDYLSVHWRVGNSSARFLHTYLSRIEIPVATTTQRCGKILVAAKADPEELADVLHQIRAAASAA